MALPSDEEPNLIVDRVFLGSKVHAKNRELLERLQITHVLNVTPPKTVDPIAGVPNFFEKDKALTYRRCALFDNKAEDITMYFEGCIAFIEQARFYGRVLVHCNKGVSRSVSIVVAYLIKIHNFSAEEALDFVKQRRPVASPNESFLKQLTAYEVRVQMDKKREQAETTKNSKANRTKGAIGPQLPPHLMKSTGVSDESSTKNASDKALSTPSISIVGPQHLPAKRRWEEEQVSSDSKQMEQSVATPSKRLRQEKET